MQTYVRSYICAPDLQEGGGGGGEGRKGGCGGGEGGEGQGEGEGGVAKTKVKKKEGAYLICRETDAGPYDSKCLQSFIL